MIAERAARELADAIRSKVPIVVRHDVTEAGVVLLTIPLACDARELVEWLRDAHTLDDCAEYAEMEF